MKVYVVEEGCYSDSWVIGVFSDIKTAKEYEEKYQDIYWSEHEIDEHPDTKSLSTIRDKNGLIPYAVFMFRDGELLNIRMDHYTPLIRGEGDHNKFDRKEFWETDKKFYKTYLETHVLARNEKHAIKIANDRRTMLIANGEWPDDIVVPKRPPRPSDPLSSSD